MQANFLADVAIYSNSQICLRAFICSVYINRIHLFEHFFSFGKKREKKMKKARKSEKKCR